MGWEGKLEYEVVHAVDDDDDPKAVKRIIVEYHFLGLGLIT